MPGKFGVGGAEDEGQACLPGRFGSSHVTVLYLVKFSIYTISTS